MVTLTSAQTNHYNGVKAVIEEYTGKSGDTKPTLPTDRNGSSFYEMDTQDVYMYDGDTQTWILQ